MAFEEEVRTDDKKDDDLFSAWLWIHPAIREPLEKFPNNPLLLNMLQTHLPPRSVVIVHKDPVSSLISRLKEKQLSRKTISGTLHLPLPPWLSLSSPNTCGITSVVAEDPLPVLKFTVDYRVMWTSHYHRNDTMYCERDDIHPVNFMRMSDTSIRNALAREARDDYGAYEVDLTQGDVRDDGTGDDDEEDELTDITLDDDSVTAFINRVRELEAEEDEEEEEDSQP